VGFIQSRGARSGSMLISMPTYGSTRSVTMRQLVAVTSDTPRARRLISSLIVRGLGMSNTRVFLTALMIGAAVIGYSAAHAALRDVSSWNQFGNALPSSLSASSVVQHVQSECSRSRGGYSDAGSGMTAPRVRVDRTCQQGASCQGELFVHAGDTIRFNISCR